METSLLAKWDDARMVPGDAFCAMRAAVLTVLPYNAKKLRCLPSTCLRFRVWWFRKNYF
jgi:hypothetical protein